MDIVTQGIVGAVFAQTAADKKHIRLASLTGFIGAVLADADVLIHSANDPLLKLEFHRQFSHSLLFIPFGALLAALLLWPLLRKRLPFSRLYLFSLLGYGTAGLLDACTSYGTQLLWPFSTERIAWRIISIVDPIFTGILLLMLVLAWKSRKKLYAFVGISLALSYLLFASYQQQSARHLQQELAQQRGHIIERSIVKPTFGNTLLWRSLYASNGHYYVDAFRIGIFSQPRFFPGSRIEVWQLPPESNEESRQIRDLRRFTTLSQGYLVRHPDDPQVIADIRFAILPNSIKPLWGVRLNPDTPEKHVSEATFRKFDEKTRQQFLDMLF